MAAICAEELQLMQQKSTRGALLIEYIVATLGLPFAFISIAILSIYLFILTFLYFKQLSIERLNVCYDITKPYCVKCLKRVYKNEQIMLKNSRKLQNVRIMKWIYQWMIERLEDRAEILIFTVDEHISEKLVTIISDIEAQKPMKSNWTKELHAL
ncbi:MAG: hypothetical protein ACLPT6_03655 [Desulfobaccales bacterium]